MYVILGISLMIYSIALVLVTGMIMMKFKADSERRWLQDE
jgi:hypothetical protein